MDENLRRLAAELRDAARILRRMERAAAKEDLRFSQGEHCGRASAYEEVAEKIEGILIAAPI